MSNQAQPRTVSPPHTETLCDAENDNLKCNYIQGEVNGSIVDKLSIPIIAENIFGLNKKNIGRITTTKWALPQEELKEYQAACITGEAKDKMYQPFMKLTRGVLRTVIETVDGEDQQSLDNLTNIIWQNVDAVSSCHKRQSTENSATTGGYDVASSNSYTSTRTAQHVTVEPSGDIGTQTLSVVIMQRPGLSNMAPKWGAVQHPIEFIQKRVPNRVHQRRTQNAAATATPSGYSSQRSSARDLQSITSDTDTATDESYAAGTKRKRCADENENDSEGSLNPAKRFCMDLADDLGVSVENAQLAAHAAECLTKTYRLYTTGIFVKSFNITLWYYDRQLVTRTAAFNLVEEPGLFALLL
ncbi:hypothetical protein FA15DRAFT_706980 [Coprinopsis marcescibilis]|uniref:Fungal-type protein kinase domain-containing protein n=1 Tax=Coprinopsis marcescibilis TaxID=230819 RepID=A0A5C3KPF0_COPMA|nr:hypothetical protein FA15DRAFT_706980 [Coprinopsis marcescibilis]